MQTEPHLGGAYECGDANTLTFDVFGFLAVKYELKNMIDVGCGFGHAMKWFSESGIPATGFDGDPNCVERCVLPGAAKLHDFTKGAPSMPESVIYDLGWSSEFLEHVEGRFLPFIMEVFKQCKHVCITHGEPGQPGHYHVTLLSNDEWIKHFAHYGFILDSVDTALMRKTDRWKAGWGRRTLTLFHNSKFQ